MNTVMGSNERREREKAELRARILDAARELFAEHGFEAVTMRKIAERIEYTQAALYFHFPDKDALIRELCVHDFYEFGQRFAALASEKDPIERLRQAGRAYADFAISHPQHYRLMFMVPDNAKDNDADWKGDPAHDAYAFLRWTCQEAIEQGRMKPEFADADLASQTAWAAIHGVVSLHITHCQGNWIAWRSLEARIDAACDALVSGMVLAPTKAKSKKKSTKDSKE